MRDTFGWLFGTQGFVPHGFCLLWRPQLVALHVVSDALIAMAYFAIPVAIWAFVRRRTDLEPAHRRMAVLFAVFITSCGFTHLAAIATLWQPYYGVEGLLKALTALVSVATALMLPVLVPELVKIPSPATLQAEVAAHRRTLGSLERSHVDLERQVAERTEQLRIANKRFENALINSSVTVYEQDEDLRYTWMFNPGAGRAVEELVGFTEAEIMPDAAEDHQAYKLEALATGEARRRELCATRDGETYWFDVRVEPAMLADGRRGLVGAATDITPQKRQQEHLQVVLSELNHRSKNLLTIVQVIAYQTSVGLDLPPAFLRRLSERLQGLAQAHDVLVNHNWAGADLRAVIESQLQHQLHAHRDRIDIVGGPFILDSKVAHYVAMAFHELGANASKYGALSGPTGRVEVRWNSEPDADGTPMLRLQWTETEGPPVGPITRKGFGRTILEVITAQAANGRTDLAFDETGVRWSLVAPLETLG